MTDHDPTHQGSTSREPTRQEPTRQAPIRQHLVDSAAAPVPPRLTRRTVLSLGLALAGSGLLPTLNALAQVSNPATDPMLVVVADPAAAVGLGRAYLAAYPAEADAEQLRSLLRQTLFADRSRTAEDGNAFCQGLVRALRDDYIGGEVIDLNGWQISRGEARLYALAALYSPDPA